LADCPSPGFISISYRTFPHKHPPFSAMIPVLRSLDFHGI
jgi:hypothetical protein